MFALDDLNNNELEPAELPMEEQDMFEPPMMPVLPAKSTHDGSEKETLSQKKKRAEINDLVEFLTSEDEDERKRRENSKWIKIEGIQNLRISEKEKEIEINLNVMDERLGEIGLGKPLDNLEMDHVQWMNPNN